MKKIASEYTEPTWTQTKAITLRLLILLLSSGAFQTLGAEDFVALPYDEGKMTRFEPDGLPAGWTAPDWGKSAFAKQEEQDETFLTMTWPHLGTLYPTSILAVDSSWEKVRVATKIRIASLDLGTDPGGVMVRITFLDENGALIRNFDSATVDRETDWTEFTIEAEVPDKSAQLKIEPGFYGAFGSIDIKQVALSVVASGDKGSDAVSDLKPGVQVEKAAESAVPANAQDAVEAARRATTPPTIPLISNEHWSQVPVESLSSVRERMVLSGEWNFLPVSEGKKDEEGNSYGVIRVPGSWKESSLPGIQKRGEGPAWSVAIDKIAGGWFSRTVEIPAEWDGQTILLELTRVSTDATVVVNGKEAGSVGLHFGSPAFGTVDITDVAKPGQANRIDILVTADTSETDYIQMMGVSEGQQVQRRRAIPFAGLTGDVVLNTRPKGAHISDVFVQPSTRKQELKLEIELSGLKAAGDARLVAEMLDEDGSVEKAFETSIAIKAGDLQSMQVNFTWEDPRLWDFKQPNLYTLRLRIEGPGIKDVYVQTFGFREFWIDGREFYLNGTPFRLRPVFRKDHAGYPSLIDSQLRADIELGFNCLQLWPADPYATENFQDVVARRADLMGMPVMGITVPLQWVANSWSDPAYQEEFLRLYRRDLRRLRNHPSIILWGSSGNYFGHGQDQNPRLLGRQDWIPEREQASWQYGSRSGTRAILEKMKLDDPTRPFYMHAGTHIGDFPTSNNYLNFIPLQEREEWMSEWAKTGTHPWWAVEFGLPLEYSFLRSRRDPVYSERLFTEHIATMKGAAAYLSEPEGYREYHRKFYRGTDAAKLKELGATPDFWPENSWLHSHWGLPDKYDATQSPAYVSFLELHVRNTYRSWRTQGLTSLPMPWAFGRGMLSYEGDKDGSVKLPPFEPGQSGAWQESLPQIRFFSVPGKSVELHPVAQALQEANSETLAWIAGPADIFTAKDHAFWRDEVVQKSLALLNDTRTPQDYSFEWAMVVDGIVIKQEKASGQLKVGETRFVPVQIALKDLELTSKTDAVITMSGKIGEHAHEDSFSFRVFPQPSKLSGLTVELFDPEDQSRKLLEDLGVSVQDWKGDPTDNLVVIGRKALMVPPPASLENFVRQGGRVLLMAQPPEWNETALALRVAKHMSRKVFPVDQEHPVLSGLDELDLRDWRGESTLVEPYPDYGTVNQLPPYGWKWGNRGGLTSGAIEKPHHAGWRPILEAEFDLAYTPLMELDYGKGRMIWSSLDLEDYVGTDPVATLLARQLLEYASNSPLTQWNRDTVLLSKGEGKALLDGIGLVYEMEDALPATGGLAIIARDVDVSDDAIRSFMGQGGRVLFLARESEDAPLGVGMTKTDSAGMPSPLPQWPELRGISMSDTRTRAPISAWVVNGDNETAAGGLIGRVQNGDGVAIFYQMNPSKLDTEKEPFLRYTRWRQTRTLVQLLANLGASFRLDSYIPLVRSAADRVPLGGTWQVRAFEMSPCAADVQNIPSVPPISEDAAESVRGNMPDEEWKTAEVPGMWEGFNMRVGEAVFRRVVYIPEDWAGQDLELSLGALDDADITHWNGEEVGKGEGWNRPRNYVVPGNLVKAGDNVLAIRLYNNYRDGGFNAVASEIYALPTNQEAEAGTGFYHPDYRTDHEFGDSPYRYHRW